MTLNPSNNPIEPWQLTAYALNELEPIDASRVKQALKADASLRTEFKQIQQTLSAVRTAFSESSASVKLSENQTAAVVNKIQQVDTPQLPSTMPTVKLASRPFFIRKRFAALLATAAAIPLAATWLPTFNKDDIPFAVSVPQQTQPRPKILNDDVQHSPMAASETSLVHEGIVGDERAPIVTSPDAITAGSGLIGDVDISLIPEMGLVIIKGSKRDVLRVKEVIDEQRLSQLRNEGQKETKDKSYSTVLVSPLPPAIGRTRDWN